MGIIAREQERAESWFLHWFSCRLRWHELPAMDSKDVFYQRGIGRIARRYPYFLVIASKTPAPAPAVCRAMEESYEARYSHSYEWKRLNLYS